MRALLASTINYMPLGVATSAIAVGWFCFGCAVLGYDQPKPNGVVLYLGISAPIISFLLAFTIGRLKS